MSSLSKLVFPALLSLLFALSSFAQNSQVKWSSFSSGFSKFNTANTTGIASIGESFISKSSNGTSNIISGFLSYKFTSDTGGIEVPYLPFVSGTGSVIVWGDSIYYFGGTANWAGTILYPFIYKFDGVSWSFYDSIPDNYVWGLTARLIGNEVYLNGGDRAGSVTPNRKYNMISKEWVNLTASPNLSPTFGLTSEVYNGELYLFDNNGDVFVYNISSDSWETKTQNTASGNYPNVTSILYNNDIYVTGWDNSAFYKYSPSTDQWTKLANTPYPVYACAMGIINGLIYCVGGNDGFNYATYKSAMIYNITDNSWSIDSAAISSNRDWMASAEYKGNFYVFGGLSNIGSGNAVDIVEQIIPHGTVGVDDDEDAIPTFYKLNQNYPNPFNPSTVISWQLPVSSHVSLKIYDVLGNEVAALVNEEKSAGTYKVTFDGSSLASGIYIYRIIAGDFVSTKKMLLIK